MVNFASLFTVALAATCSSAVSVFLTTQQAAFNGATRGVRNQLLVYDNNTLTPCTSSTQDAFCGTDPKYNGTKISGCDAVYNGTRPWKSVTGFFVNNNGVFVTDGVVGSNKKDGASDSGQFIYNVTNNANCKKYSCERRFSGSDAVITYGGFRCTV